MNNNTLVTCPVCEGSGLDTTQDSTCPMCGGIGSVTKAEHDEYDKHMSPDNHDMESSVCGTCGAPYGVAGCGDCEVFAKKK